MVFSATFQVCSSTVCKGWKFFWTVRVKFFWLSEYMQHKKTQLFSREKQSQKQYEREQARKRKWERLSGRKKNKKLVFLFLLWQICTLGRNMSYCIWKSAIHMNLYHRTQIWVMCKKEMELLVWLCLQKLVSFVSSKHRKSSIQINIRLSHTCFSVSP